MSLRTTLASALCLALAASVVAIYFRQPLAALAVAASAAAGAALSSLLRGGGTRRRASDGARADAGVESGPRARPDLAAVDGAEAGAVSTDELLDALMGSMREGLLVVDGGMRVVALNAAAREIFGAGDAGSANRIGGAGGARPSATPLSLAGLTRSPAVLGAFAESLARGRHVEVKVESAGRDGRAYDLRVAPLKPRGGWGARRGAVGVFFDITRLERLERVRQEFLSNVSHELRTPLAAIRAFVETLEAGALDDPAHNRRFLSIIDRNAARMHALITDTLELSAIESGEVAVEPRRVLVRPLVEHVLTSLAGRAAERGVALFNDVPEGATLRADERRLEQMLTNLADNAVKFNREGGEVRVRFESDGARDRVLVADTGEGIAREHVGRIFERFYRVDRARSRAVGGTGLGLAIVKHLAHAHGGEVTVASAPGEGSVFTVELPRGENDECGMMN
ncbi:MAG TPA: ATP-binding protein [Pyrinomonadaceae bacterium]|jgi:two-component system phosphate regulon sensor histidine kinase PhoR